MIVSRAQQESIQSITGSKENVKTTYLIVNGDTIKPEEISTRGQSSLQFKRKSFSFKLNSGAVLRHGEKTIKLKRFDLVNLSMDKYYIRNRLAFDMMNRIELFDLFYTFCNLKINGKSDGIFMIIERPEDWAIRKVNSPYLLRRGYNHAIAKIKTNKKVERNEIKKYQNAYAQIYKTLKKYEGEELYNNLSNYIDLNNYMKWLAFNFFVHNGDYSDEVFFFIDPTIAKFRVIPWDYDDIFAAAPHEGKVESKKIVGDKLIFSSEDLLDVKIAKDPYLYNIYISTFKKILEDLPLADLKAICEGTYAELYPYYSDNEIISNSQYDVYKDANLENLKTEMVTVFLGLRGTRERYLDYLGN
jgi:spore coat protein H